MDKQANKQTDRQTWQNAIPTLAAIQPAWVITCDKPEARYLSMQISASFCLLLNLLMTLWILE